jgi:hypothetical protein
MNNNTTSIEIKKTNNMKKLLFVIVLALGLGSQLLAQNSGKDYVVVDQSAQNLAQLQAQFNGQTQVFFNDNTKPAPYVIGQMLENNHVVDLHIYVATKPGELDFNSVKITAANAGEYDQFFKDWKPFISGKVIIHSSDVFSTPAGAELKTRLEELSGLDFTTP